MATERSTSLDAAIRSGDVEWWAAPPLAFGLLLYLAVGIPVALTFALFRKVSESVR